MNIIEKIKYIKIEDEEGNLSENIPIGVDAKNIDTESGINIENELKDISEKNNNQDELIANLENQIQKINLNTPLPADGVEQMTDHNKIYVNTQDGYWYYYDNNNQVWTKGNIYQSTLLGEKSVSLKNLDDELQADNASIKFQKNINKIFNIMSKQIIPLMNYADNENSKMGLRYASYDDSAKTIQIAEYANTAIIPPFPVYKGVRYYVIGGMWVNPWSFLTDFNGNYLGNITRETSDFHYWTCPSDGYAFCTFENVKNKDVNNLKVIIDSDNDQEYLLEQSSSNYGESYDYWMLKQYRYTKILDDIENIESKLQSDNGHIKITVGIDKEYTTITSAVASITDSSKDQIYDIVIDNGIYEERDITLPNYVNIIGASGNKDKCIIQGYLPADTDPSDISPSSTFNISNNNEFHNVTITAQNMRYPVHNESGGTIMNWNQIVDNCYIWHKGNEEAKQYQEENDGDPSLIWSSIHAWGEGASSGAYLKVSNSTFRSDGGNAFYTHAAPTISKPYIHILENCHLLGDIGIDDTTSPIDGDTLLINNCDIQGRISIVGTKKYNMIISGSGIHPIYQKPERVLLDTDFPIFTDYLKRIKCTDNVSRGQFVYSDDGMQTVKKATSSTPKKLIVGYVVGNWSANNLIPIMTAGSLQPIEQSWPEVDSLTPGLYYKVGDDSMLTLTENIEDAIAISSTRWYWLLI